MMQTYYGTKEVKGELMSLGEFNKLKGWAMSEGQDPETAGYLVEYKDGGKANHPDYKGYISWSPLDVFRNAYKQSGELTFGDAILAAKAGAKVSRAGWNGKGMWVIYNPGSKGETHGMFEGSVYRNPGVEECEILPHFDMYTVNAAGKRAMLPGWLASQSDMDAEDRCIV